MRRAGRWPLMILPSLLCVGRDVGTAAAAEPDAVRDLGDRRELFVDDWLIDTTRGVTLRLHPAMPREVALPLNQPWAGPTVGFTSVFKDGDRYRLYYTNDSDGQRPDCTSYAEGKDGIHWVMPKLGFVELNGSKDNNLVWRGTASQPRTPATKVQTVSSRLDLISAKAHRRFRRWALSA